jgi:molybdate transport system substrate-binding protein
LKLRTFALLAIILMLLLASCAQQPPATQTAVQPTASATEAPVATEAGVVTEAPQVTEAPTAVPTEKVDLNVFAAASLTEPFGEIRRMFEAAHPGVAVVYNFAASQKLAQQINEGAPADVFASANMKQMSVIIDAGSVISGTEQTFAKNRLVVIYPKDNPASIKELKDLDRPDLKLVLAAKEVPVGQYALDFMDKAVADPAFGATFKDDVLKNVVSYEDNVKSVLIKVVLGEADAGIVYLSDISGADADKVGKIDIPDTLNVIASYPIAMIKNSKNPELAQAFIDLVLSSEGQDILAKHNFITVK